MDNLSELGIARTAHFMLLGLFGFGFRAIHRTQSLAPSSLENWVFPGADTASLHLGKSDPHIWELDRHDVGAHCEAGLLALL